MTASEAPNGETRAIHAVGLSKRYGDRLVVDRFHLDVARGEFFGLLGPNGAGKTTAVHMLSTLVRPTQGEAWIAGHSVLQAPVSVRGAIGVVFQEPSLDRNLTVEENIRFAGMLNHLPTSVIRSRSDELLDMLGLTDQRQCTAASLSGGKRRALDIARGLIHHPRVLFLDEPTTGLDLPSRRAIWRHIARLRAELGTTVLLTTHYLEEAGECDRVGFVDKGRMVREGVPRELVRELGDYIVEIEAPQPQLLAQALFARLGNSFIEDDVVTFRFDGNADALAELQKDLGPQVRGLRWRRPNLNDVFLGVLHEHTQRGIASQAAPRRG